MITKESFYCLGWIVAAELIQGEAGSRAGRRTVCDFVPALRSYTAVRALIRVTRAMGAFIGSLLIPVAIVPALYMAIDTRPRKGIRPFGAKIVFSPIDCAHNWLRTREGDSLCVAIAGESSGAPGRLSGPLMCQATIGCGPENARFRIGPLIAYQDSCQVTRHGVCLSRIVPSWIPGFVVIRRDSRYNCIPAIVESRLDSRNAGNWPAARLPGKIVHCSPGLYRVIGAAWGYTRGECIAANVLLGRDAPNAG